MESSEKGFNRSRRGLLKEIGAVGIGLAAGLGGTTLLKHLNAEQDGAERVELPEAVKERNTVLEIEKKILAELLESPSDLEEVSKGLVPSGALEHKRHHLENLGSKREHMDIAEKRVLEWIRKFKTDWIDVFVKEKKSAPTMDDNPTIEEVKRAIQKRIDDLTNLQRSKQ